MAGPNHFLVSFENVTATVGGTDVSSIIELQVSAVANGIPSVTLLVDARHPGKAAGSGAASAMDLEAARRLYTSFHDQIRSATLSLSVTVRALGVGGGDTQTLRISGWLLTDVALSPIQIGGVVAVSLTCRHPICKAHFGGAVPGLLSREPDIASLGGGDPLSAFISALRAYETAARIDDVRPVTVDGAANPATVRDKLLTHLSDATGALEIAVSWSGGRLPASSSGISEELIRYGISLCAAPNGGTSVLSRLVNTVIPECSLALGGDFTGKTLTLRPFTPWEPANLSVNDSDLVSLQFPQSDQSPLSGVHIVSTDTADTLQYSFQYDALQKNVKPVDIFYVPDAELNAASLYGPIHQIQEPGWMAVIRSVMKNIADGGDTNTVAANSMNLQTPTNTDPDNPVAEVAAVAENEPSVNYSEALLACAKAYYETSLMKDWGFTLHCRFLLNGGGMICPGKVIAVKSSGGTVLEGYVTAVTHTISVTEKTARTSVACTHPRVGGALPRGMTGANVSQNALYA